MAAKSRLSMDKCRANSDLMRRDLVVRGRLIVMLRSWRHAQGNIPGKLFKVSTRALH